MIDARARRALGTSTLVVALTSLLLSSSGGPDAPSAAGPSPARGAGTTAPPATAAAPPAPGTGGPTPDVEKVRDVFARLQATCNDGCTTPGNCAYFPRRVLAELTSLDASMKADPQGPAHFEEPLAWIAELRSRPGGDSSFENLEKHQTLLTGTRDRINTRMRGHPEDYR